MKKKQWIPLGLTTLRLLLGPIIVACATAHVPRLWFLPMLVVGLLSDIFDGVLARRLGVATPGLRRYDSVTDVIYYLCVLAGVAIARPAAIAGNGYWIAAALASEAICVTVGFVKFQRLASAHSYLAKFFGLALFAGLTAILAFGTTAGVTPTLAAIGLLMNLEIFLILLLSNRPPVDVPTVFHAIRPSAHFPPVFERI